MSQRRDIAPETLRVSLEPEGIEVEYLDGRSVFYHGVPAKRDGSVVCPPGKDVHVLVVSPDEDQGVMVYVNDRNTHDDILESTGVGRVLLDRGEQTALFPGVEAVNLDGFRLEVRADPGDVPGRVFVFAEDARNEASYEIVEDEEPSGLGSGGMASIARKLKAEAEEAEAEDAEAEEAEAEDAEAEEAEAGAGQRNAGDGGSEPGGDRD